IGVRSPCSAPIRAVSSASTSSWIAVARISPNDVDNDASVANSIVDSSDKAESGVAIVWLLSVAFTCFCESHGGHQHHRTLRRSGRPTPRDGTHAPAPRGCARRIVVLALCCGGVPLANAGSSWWLYW